MRAIFFICFFVVTLPSLCQTTLQIAEYNKLFKERNFQSALQRIDFFLVQNPLSFDLHREKAKLLAALGDSSGFISELNWMRETNDPDSIPAILDAVRHPLITENQRNLAYEYFISQNDTFILNSLSSEKPIQVISIPNTSTSPASPPYPSPISSQSSKSSNSEKTGDGFISYLILAVLGFGLFEGSRCPNCRSRNIYDLKKPRKKVCKDCGCLW